MPDFASDLGESLNGLAALDVDSQRLDAARDRLEEAIAWQRKALAANPKNSTYRRLLIVHLKNLIVVARDLGRGDVADEARRELAELQAADPRFAALDARLAAVLGGEAPKDNAERLALAQRADETNRYAAAARFLGEALDADPKLAEDRRAQHAYNAACAATLAASARSSPPAVEGGKAAAPPSPAVAGEGVLDDTARARLRERARGWLAAELAMWAKVLEARPEAGQDVAQALRHWQVDPDLAGVRDATELRGLPEAEWAACHALWADVADLLLDAAFPTEPFTRER